MTSKICLYGKHLSVNNLTLHLGNPKANTVTCLGMGVAGSRRLQNYQLSSIKEKKKKKSLTGTCPGWPCAGCWAQETFRAGRVLSPCLQEKKVRLREDLPKVSCEEMRPPSLEPRAPNSKFGVLSPAHTSSMDSLVKVRHRACPHSPPPATVYVTVTVFSPKEDAWTQLLDSAATP